ncbi:MarR family winged helix-turn-helix transcriptional regulator [Caloranaerobacter sp. DY30410]|uniref:MarR family winged helix-turn-helix transcriptional regulator n=1 Tax=Caloranaerobacter sp. DY30410 TaxID=3238305 RepID=UPI003D07F7F0
MFDIDTCLSFVTSKACKEIAEAFNKRLMKLGVTRVQWIALYYLGKCEGIKQKELAEKMNIKDSTVARLIDRMEREGYVIRVKDLEDERITKLYLTEKGIELREKLLPEGKKMSEILSKNITDEEMEIFKRVLKKMVDNVR